MLKNGKRLFYLRGLLASQLTDLSYFPVAEESLNLVINTYTTGEYCDDALYTLGALYYGSKNYEKAKNTFVKLGKEHPGSEYAAASWFWAAEAATYVGENPNLYRSHVVADYPKSEWAPEAYLRQFSYAMYVDGSPEAISHIKEFVSRFPDSPLLITANYLIGINEDTLEHAKAAFEGALSAFSLHSQKNGSLDKAYIYCRYQAMLELASLYLNSDTNLEECEQLLTTLVNDFSQKDHPLTSLLKQKTSYPPQFEEGEFKLVHCYLKGGKDFNAQKLLAQMLTHYSDSGIQHGYLLSQVWQEQGKLSLKCGDYDTALHCFEIAQECGSGYSSDEQELTLWLLQSDAF